MRCVEVIPLCLDPRTEQAGYVSLSYNYFVPYVGLANFFVGGHSRWDRTLELVHRCRGRSSFHHETRGVAPASSSVLP